MPTKRQKQKKYQKKKQNEVKTKLGTEKTDQQIPDFTLILPDSTQSNLPQKDYSSQEHDKLKSLIQKEQFEAAKERFFQESVITDPGLKEQRQRIADSTADSHWDAELELEKVADPKKFLRRLEDKRGWYRRMPKGRAEEWLMDCYCLNIDDNYTQKMKFTGILAIACDKKYYRGSDANYAIRSTDYLLADFYKFLKLAELNETLPPTKYFNFEKLIDIAAGRLQYSFEKEDAEEKYGIEHKFNNGPSLRRQAKFVYDITGVTKKKYQKDPSAKIAEDFISKFPHFDDRTGPGDNPIVPTVCLFPSLIGEHSGFDNFGGEKLWIDLYLKIMRYFMEEANKAREGKSIGIGTDVAPYVNEYLATTSGR